MKKIINITALIIVVFTGIILYSGGCGGLATQQQVQKLDKRVEDFHKEFQAEMDSIHWEIDSVAADVRYIKADTDSLKKGQIIIYRNVKMLIHKNKP